jgi:GGDEF domain-containing protein
LQGLVNLTPDSSKISSLYGDAAAPRKLAPGEASRHNVLEQAGDRKDIVVVPAVEQSHIVGSLHIKAPKLGLLDGEGDKELLFDFMNLVPVTLRQAMASQAASELMLVDPVTRVANREGLSRDLDREIGRARRAHRQVGLVGIRLCGLEGMANLSQQHIQTQLLSEVAHKIASGLRATDAVGRIDTMCFGVLVTEAPPDSIESICTRYQNELQGNLLDDGAGGSIEILPNVSWVSIDPHDYSGRAVSELSEMMLESVLEASACAPSGSVSIARAEPQ